MTYRVKVEGDGFYVCMSRLQSALLMCMQRVAATGENGTVERISENAPDGVLVCDVEADTKVEEWHTWFPVIVHIRRLA